jgi:hypothetical protein
MAVIHPVFTRGRTDEIELKPEPQSQSGSTEDGFAASQELILQAVAAGDLDTVQQRVAGY